MASNQDLLSVLNQQIFYIHSADHFNDTFFKILEKTNNRSFLLVFASDLSPEEKGELVSGAKFHFSNATFEEIAPVVPRSSVGIQSFRVSSVEEVPAPIENAAVIIVVDETVPPDEYLRICCMAGIRGFFMGSGHFCSPCLSPISISASKTLAPAQVAAPEAAPIEEAAVAEEAAPVQEDALAEEDPIHEDARIEPAPILVSLEIFETINVATPPRSVVSAALDVVKHLGLLGVGIVAGFAFGSNLELKFGVNGIPFSYTVLKRR